jgi:prepilin-type N-terminal cleavage/methylation domain-containing protein
LKRALRTKGSGFTVTELMLVITIIALVAGIGGGLYRGTYKRLRVERAARDFWYTAKLARITAIERQSPCEIELDVEKNGYSVLVYEFDEENKRTNKVPPRGTYARPVQMDDKVKFEDVRVTPLISGEGTTTSEGKTIVFSPNGTAQETVIQIGDGENHYTVSINPATARATLITGTAKDIETKTVDLDEEL